MKPEKHGVTHVEATTGGNDVQQEKHAAIDSERVPEAMGRDASELPKGYFYSLMFVGSYTAIGKSPSSHFRTSLLSLHSQNSLIACLSHTDFADDPCVSKGWGLWQRQEAML